MWQGGDGPFRAAAESAGGRALVDAGLFGAVTLVEADVEQYGFASAG